MRALLLLGFTITAGCDLRPVPTTGQDDSGDATCPQAGWVPATDARLTMTSFVLDGMGITVGFEPGAVYETGPSACVDPEGGGAAFTFAVAGEPYGTVTMIAPETGGLTVGADGSFEVTLFGEDPPITFGNSTWVLGSWDVQSLLPFAVTVTNAQAQDAGRALAFSFTAEAAP